MLDLKKLLFWPVVLTVGYYALDYVKVHTSGDVIAYKRFAKALMQNDYSLARQISNKELAVEVASKRAERNKFFSGVRPLFTYHEVISQHLSSDGKSSRLLVEQVTRVGTKGQVGFGVMMKCASAAQWNWSRSINCGK